MDIGRCFKDAWNLLMKDLAPLAVTAVIAAVVIGVPAAVMGLAALRTGGSTTSFTLTSDNQVELNDANWGLVVLLGIVVAVLALVVGAWEYSTLLKIMLRRVRENRAAEMGDLKLGLEGIGAFMVALLVLGLLIGIGFVFLIIPGLILMTIWAYALVLIADKRSGLGEAMSGSSALAKAPGYLMTFVTLLVGGIVVGIVSGILGMIPVVGQIIGLFLGLYMAAYLVAMYFQATGETHLLDHALYGTPLPEAAPGYAGYPSAPAPPTAGTAYPPGPSAPMVGAPVPPPPAPPAPAPPAPAPAPPPAASVTSPAPAPEPPSAAAARAPAPPPPAAAPAASPKPGEDAWAAAADPLAKPAAPEEDRFEPPSTSAEPAVDEQSPGEDTSETT